MSPTDPSHPANLYDWAGRLRAAIRAAGWDVRTLAETRLTTVGRSMLSMIVTGHRIPSVATQAELAKVLKVPATHLFPRNAAEAARKPRKKTGATTP